MPTTLTSDVANLEYAGKPLSLPVITGSEGEVGIDISQLRGKTGAITFDPGFGNTGACRSAVTFIDGEKGILRYRGYPIEELSEKSTFLEVAWLLIKGELPTGAQLAGFTDAVKHHTMVHQDFGRFFEGFPKDAHPMPVCAAAVGALATFYQDPETPPHIEDSVTRLIAKMPTIASYSYKHSIGQPFMYPKNSLGYASNFLHMMFATPCEEFEVNPVLAKAVDLLLILHADHEQNCSTSAVRGVGSSHVDPFSAVSAGIAALYGPLHGGANEAVLRMLDEVGDVKNVPAFIETVKAGKGRLMGFGHRVYKSYDPRAKLIKAVADQVFEQTGLNPKLEIALELERIALDDDYFVSRKLYPNVDFYSGLIYQAMGYPTDYFTVLFALGRLPGWIAQWEEMLNDPEQKISRPRQLYVGHDVRDFVPMEAR